jgi:cell wall-associated NlpC family hydrolase
MNKFLLLAAVSPLGIILAVFAFLLCAGPAVLIPTSYAGLPLASSVSGPAPSQVPAEYWTWYVKAGQLCPSMGVTPVLLAAQGYQESGFNPKAVSPTGAEGIAQFEPGTWPQWSGNDDGTGVVTPFNPNDAIMAQGRYMCALATDATNAHLATASTSVVMLALAGYNAGWGAVTAAGGIPHITQTEQYVTNIMKLAAQWAQETVGTTVPGSGSGSSAATRALSWLGEPYVYGDENPQDGPNTGFCSGTPDNGDGWLNGSCFAADHVGFDCSGLVMWSWWPYVQLPRVAEDQYIATDKHRVSTANLQPGDLLFLSTGGVAGIYHVGMYVGNGNAVQAPHTGESVKETPASAFTSASDYYGATDPAG